MAGEKWHNLKYYYLDNRTFLQDSAALVVAVIVTGWLVHVFDAGEMLYVFTRNYEGLELDEILLTVFTSCFYLFLFAVRRYLDLRRMIIKAHTDPLIGILNRGRGSEVIRRELKRLEKGTRQSVLMMLDIDDFKQINDTYGHEQGDVVLRTVAAVIQREIREVDQLIRWGGEEFLLLCPDTTLASGMMLAERLRGAIAAQRFNFISQVTASFGVVRLVSGQNLRDQIARVDDRLYTSKRMGKNRVTGAQSSGDML